MDFLENGDFSKIFVFDLGEKRKEKRIGGKKSWVLYQKREKKKKKKSFGESLLVVYLLLYPYFFFPMTFISHMQFFF